MTTTENLLKYNTYDLQYLQFVNKMEQPKSNILWGGLKKKGGGERPTNTVL